MINILLLLITIAALGGMVFCNRKQKKGPKYQLIALGLMVVVLISSGIFMYRIDTLSLLGLQTSNEQLEAIEQKFDKAKAFKTAEYIEKNAHGKGNVLILTNKRNKNYSGFLVDSMQKKKFNTKVERFSSLKESDATPAKICENIEKIYKQNSNVKALVIAGLSSNGEELEKLNLFMLPAEKRPVIILITGASVSKGLYEPIKNNLLSAVIVIDLTKAQNGEKMPENLTELFDSRFTLVDKSNVERNKTFFGL